MTQKGIKKMGEREAIKHEAALAIRKVLDEAREKYGADAWDADEAEAAVLELVAEEDPS
jgi:hypothetical protein